MRRWAWSRVLKFGENWKGGGSISGTAQAGKEHGTWGGFRENCGLKRVNGLGCEKTGLRCGVHGKQTGIRKQRWWAIWRVTQHFLCAGETKLRKR